MELRFTVTIDDDSVVKVMRLLDSIKQNVKEESAVESAAHRLLYQETPICNDWLSNIKDALQTAGQKGILHDVCMSYFMKLVQDLGPHPDPDLFQSYLDGECFGYPHNPLWDYLDGKGVDPEQFDFRR